MNASGAGTPRRNRVSTSPEIGQWIEYARENIERSRMLFGKGDLRYAVFSANEGLELCTKAFMLRYEIIDRGVVAGHFPYPAALKKMIEITKLNIKRDPADKKRYEQTLDSLRRLERIFNTTKKKSLEIQLWKFSLEIELTDEENEQVDKFLATMANEHKEMHQMQSGSRDQRKQCNHKHTPSEQADLFAEVSRIIREESWRQGSSRPLSLPGGLNLPYSGVLEIGQVFALTDLIILAGIISISHAHQQISRYPTQIDGVDSQKVYADNKDVVEDLLGRIYTASECLLSHLEHGAPFLIQYAIGVGADIGELALP